jgi:hypothetical protein
MPIKKRHGIVMVLPLGLTAPPEWWGSWSNWERQAHPEGRSARQTDVRAANR